MSIKKIKITGIRIDGGTQSRAELNQATVSEYAEAMADGAKFPPVVVFFDGADHWLADGFHRYFGAKQIGALDIDADVRDGTKRDAILFSSGANAAHGLRRSNADKRKAVETLLKDVEWCQWSDRKIAEACGVGAPLVGSVRKAICNPITDTPVVRKVERAGKTYEQDTTNIGKATAQRTGQGDVTQAARSTAPEHHANNEPLEDEDYTETDALRDQVSELQIEITRLKLLVPAEADEGNEMLEDLKHEIALLQKANKAITESRDRLQAENAELKKQCAWMKKKLKG